MKLTTHAYWSVLWMSYALAACGSEDEKELGEVGDRCAVGDESSVCAAGLSCDPLVTGEGYVCGNPLAIEGVISDALTGDAVAGSRVVALGVDGSPVGEVGLSDASGAYSVVVSALRDPDGTIAAEAKWTLSVSAQGYDAFPGGPRPALPIFAGDSTDTLLRTPTTDVTLLPIRDPEGHARQISGTISAAEPAGTLVVAQGGDVPGPHAIASRTGEFTLFNVPSGVFEVWGYKRGQQLAPVEVDVADGSVSDVRLQSSEQTLGSVSGNVNIVNAPGGSLTSVVLVPASVFDPVLARGPIPLGLRAPGLPEAPSISSQFQFDEVPLGDYVVLAAFENDALVRDPDASIAGTNLQTVSVVPRENVAMGDSFKITEHLAILSPGAESPESVSGSVTFQWADDSSEDRYELELYTALGDLVWEDRAVPSVSGSASVELGYSGPALMPGMIYQFRVTSFREQRGESTAISRSEDLRGVFEYR